MSNGVGTQPVALARLLLDFAASPGRHALRAGEPRALFAQLDTLAQWALGRLPEQLRHELGEERARELGSAAILFIQRACLDPDNTHYQVLGLAPGAFSPATLRARYRALIRLVHPDAGIRQFPASAAGMVNRAHAVLGDESSRRQYDAQLAQGMQRAAAAPAARAGAGMGPAGAPAGTSGHPSTGRIVRAPVIGRPPTWRERWASVAARYPRQVRSGLLAASVGMLVAGVALWAGMEANDAPGRVLVTAQAIDDAPLVEPHATQEATAPLHGTASLRVPDETQAIPPVQASAAIDVALAAPEPEPPHSVPAAPVQLPTPAVASVENDRPPAPSLRAVTRPVTVPAPAAARRSHEPPGAAHHAPRRQPRAAAPAPVPEPAPAAMPQAVPATPAAPAQATPPAVASLDAAGARRYLSDIVATFEQASETRRLNAYLARMRVQGSLLQPVVDLQALSPRLRVRREAWTESERDGALHLASVLTLRPLPEGEAASIFRLAAQFRAGEEGTVLVRLDLQRER